MRKNYKELDILSEIFLSNYSAKKEEIDKVRKVFSKCGDGIVVYHTAIFDPATTSNSNGR